MLLSLAFNKSVLNWTQVCPASLKNPIAQKLFCFPHEHYNYLQLILLKQIGNYSQEIIKS
jgi:hypothetical protein